MYCSLSIQYVFIGLINNEIHPQFITVNTKFKIIFNTIMATLSYKELVNCSYIFTHKN
jgi:hypothetical protein